MTTPTRRLTPTELRAIMGNPPVRAARNPNAIPRPLIYGVCAFLLGLTVASAASLARADFIAVSGEEA